MEQIFKAEWELHKLRTENEDKLTYYLDRLDNVWLDKYNECVNGLNADWHDKRNEFVKKLDERFAALKGKFDLVQAELHTHHTQDEKELTDYLNSLDNDWLEKCAKCVNGLNADWHDKRNEFVKKLDETFAAYKLALSGKHKASPKSKYTTLQSSAAATTSPRGSAATIASPRESSSAASAGSTKVSFKNHWGPRPEPALAEPTFGPPLPQPQPKSVMNQPTVAKQLSPQLQLQPTPMPPPFHNPQRASGKQFLSRISMNRETDDGRFVCAYYLEGRCTVLNCFNAHEEPIPITNNFSSPGQGCSNAFTKKCHNAYPCYRAYCTFWHTEAERLEGESNRERMQRM